MTVNLEAFPEVLFSQELIRISSITPEDKGCQDLITKTMGAFTPYRFDKSGVSNLFLVHSDTETRLSELPKPILCFAGHTDVVPTGDESSWKKKPFAAEIDDGVLFGRGAVDMKSALAAMLLAGKDFISQSPHHKGSLAYLITSDEEGEGTFGTRYALEQLKQQKVNVDYAVIGEPTSVLKVGDTIKVGRRGSINFDLSIKGKQGHIAYPQLANNPIHLAKDVLKNLIEEHWDDGNEVFEPTRLQISNIQSGTGATNVIPESLHIRFNIRFSSELTADKIVARVRNILIESGLKYELNYKISGSPYRVPEKGKLKDTLVSVIEKQMGFKPTLSTGGGISDGRFFAQSTPEVIECGLLNASIHKIDEQTPIADITNLKQIYYAVMKSILDDGNSG